MVRCALNHMRPRQLDGDSLERLLDDGLQVKQWREDGRLHLEIHGSWQRRPVEVDKRIATLVDLRHFSTSLTGTDPTCRTRFISYKAHHD